MATVGYLYGDSGQLLMMKDGADWKGFEPDGLASTGRVIRDDGLTQNTYRYDAYGNVLSKTSVVQNNWQWGSRPGTYTLPVANGFPVTSLGSWGWIPTIVLTGSGIRVGPRPGYGTDDYWRIINKNLRNWPPIYRTGVRTRVIPGATPRRRPPKSKNWIPPVPPVNTPWNGREDPRPPIPRRSLQGPINDLKLFGCFACCAISMYKCFSWIDDCTEFKIDVPKMPGMPMNLLQFSRQQLPSGGAVGGAWDSLYEQLEADLARKGRLRRRPSDFQRGLERAAKSYNQVAKGANKGVKGITGPKCFVECYIESWIRGHDTTHDIHEWQWCNQEDSIEACSECCDESGGNVFQVTACQLGCHST